MPRRDLGAGLWLKMEFACFAGDSFTGDAGTGDGEASELDTWATCFPFPVGFFFTDTWTRLRPGVMSDKKPRQTRVKGGECGAGRTGPNTRFQRKAKMCVYIYGQHHGMGMGEKRERGGGGMNKWYSPSVASIVCCRGFFERPIFLDV